MIPPRPLVEYQRSMASHQNDAAFGAGIATDSGVIEVVGLRKRFGHTEVLAGLDLRVRRGEVHAFLGPNGSGKTTTLRLLLGLLRSDGGTMAVLGLDPWRDTAELHRRLAYVPGDVSLWPNLSGGEVIDLLGRMRGGLDPKRRADLIEMFDLDPTRKGRTYSKGNRQKVALVAALASDVDLYLLDEPTAGLDPLMEAAFQRCVADIRGAGKTILLSSHILSEAEVLCDRVSIIRGGVVVETGTLADLRQLTYTTVTASVRVVPEGMADVPGVHDLHVEGHTVSAQVAPHGLDGLLARLSNGGIESLVCHPPTLEELFLRHYRDGES
ncbi:MAG: polyether ionophore transport system ATP-binding protein [Actinomycetota bacterium]|nr:polyether ionophore transport system ATP-binding protein [Actinomycetota bacterium]